MDLNILLSVSGDIHDMTQAVFECRELALNGHLPSMIHVFVRLPRVLEKFGRLPSQLWQSSADREYRENLVDLMGYPPSGISDTASWMTQCLITLESLPSALLGLEYEMFVSFMIDPAALEAWPYEFEATRASFSFVESSVSADMAGTFSTAFDSIVSDQSRRPSYSKYADEILAILLSICASAMADDESYFPLNLSSYLRTHNLPDSRVLETCNTLWLCSCLTAELTSQVHPSALLSGPVVQAMWRVLFLMARQYLDSWTYKSTLDVPACALDAVRNTAASDASPSTIVLTQTNILNALSRCH